MSFSKIYTFIKDNWPVLLIVFLMVAVSFFVYSSFSDLSAKNKSLTTLVEQQQEHTLQNLADLTKSFQQQVEQQEKIQKEYNERIDALDSKYAEQLKQIQTKRKVRQKVLVDNPSNIPSAFNEVFGIPQRGTQ